MLVNEKISLLRKEMEKLEIDAYIIPSSDAHQSEYVAEHWKSRAWISGFTGSAGTIVVTKDSSGLWADGRYFIQAEKELMGSEIKLFKMGQPNVPTFIDWIYDNLYNESKVGFDGKVFSRANIEKMEDKYKSKEIKLIGDYDLINNIWIDRPNIPDRKGFFHDDIYSGKTVVEKLKLVRDEMDKSEAHYYLTSSLDNIAWLYNVRGEDVINNPVLISYALVSKEEAVLFINKEKVSKELENILNKYNIIIKEYDDICDYLNNLKADTSILIDFKKNSQYLFDCINHECKIIKYDDIVTKLKSIKNDIEIQNLRNCHNKDNVAMVKFLYWLDNYNNKNELTEISVSSKLEGLRKEQDLFVGPSFNTICGYKDHAAMMHYKANKNNQYSLDNEGMLLIDSGGQYLDGTTDITRTIALGKISDEEKHDFTLVFKGNMALSSMKFLHGATGSNLDVIARQPLWEEGIDYKCGTGHGVGFFLNVHEGPQNFSIQHNSTVLENGMILTNEPGIYKEGKYGIRLENTMIVKKGIKTEFGQFMEFEVISYCPIDLECIDINMLTEKEKSWLNTYHKKTYEILAPYLDSLEKEWLKKKTREI